MCLSSVTRHLSQRGRRHPTRILAPMGCALLKENGQKREKQSSDEGTSHVGLTKYPFFLYSLFFYSFYEISAECRPPAPPEPNALSARLQWYSVSRRALRSTLPERRFAFNQSPLRLSGKAMREILPEKSFIAAFKRLIPSGKRGRSSEPQRRLLDTSTLRMFSGSPAMLNGPWN